MVILRILNLRIVKGKSIQVNINASLRLPVGRQVPHNKFICEDDN